MMEIAYGPLIAACATKSLMFGLLFALIYPLVERRIAAAAPHTNLWRRLGLGLLSGGLFGIAHLVIECAADGFPPRIVQVTGLALLVLAAAGAGLLARPRNSALA